MRIMAISGGVYETLVPHFRYAVGMTGKKKSNLLYIGTASADSADGFAWIPDGFAPFGCTCRELPVFRENLSPDEIDRRLAWADILYVGGGDTAFMIDIWKKSGLFDRLRTLAERDAVVFSGMSAGAMCWFAGGHSDSSVFKDAGHGGYGVLHGLLSFRPFIFCPHYEDRGTYFDEAMQTESLPAFAFENNTAFIADGEKQFFASTVPGARVFSFEHTAGGAVVKTEVPTVDIR